ncbi:MAG: ribonuclease J [Mariprofundales bacterium]|nr:ribonuclease J [Mariprofundales bacterium]
MANQASNHSTATIRCYPFGGVGEFGKNMMVYAIGDDAVIVDCGLGFPSPWHHGIDLLIPDISALKELGLTIHAILLTHGHEDHIGGLPFLLPQLQLPIYGTPITLGLLSGKLEELHYKADLRPLPELEPITVGPFQVEAIPVTHSIMDAVSIAIRTPLGYIIHTGDFKLDMAPLDGRATALHRFAALGDEGVALLAADSTNAPRSGSSASERSVGPVLRQEISSCSGKVVVTTFASNMFRIQQIIDAAHANKRKVAFAGRSLERNSTIARKLGRLNIPAGIMIDIKKSKDIADRDLLIIATGSQGESRAALARLAQNHFPGVRIGVGDLVIFSSSAIPGNERTISDLVNLIYRRGARIRHAGQAHLHVSGHAQAHELKTMMHLTRPRYFYPVHGEYRFLQEHKQLARQVGIPEERIIIAENGQSVIADANSIRHGKGFHAGAVFVDGQARDEVDSVVLRDRRTLAEDGLITATVLISAAEGCLIGQPELTARGLLHQEISEERLDEARNQLTDYLREQPREALTDHEALSEDIRIWLRRWCKRTMKKRPMAIPVVIEI